MFRINVLENPALPSNSDLLMIEEELAQRADWNRITVCEFARGVELTDEQVENHCAAVGIDYWDMTRSEAREVVGTWIAVGLVFEGGNL